MMDSYFNIKSRMYGKLFAESAPYHKSVRKMLIDLKPLTDMQHIALLWQITDEGMPIL